MLFKAILTNLESFYHLKAQIMWVLLRKSVWETAFIGRFYFQDFQVFFSTRIQFWLQIFSISWEVNPAPSNKVTSLG